MTDLDKLVTALVERSMTRANLQLVDTKAGSHAEHRGIGGYSVSICESGHKTAYGASFIPSTCIETTLVMTIS